MFSSMNALNSSKSKYYSATILVFSAYLYALLSDPFIFLFFLPFGLRILVLVVPLFFVFYSYVIKGRWDYKVLIFAYFGIVLAYCFKNLDVSGTIVKNTAQFAFLLSLFLYSRQHLMNRKFLVTWLWLWSYIGACIPISFLIFHLDIFSFNPTPLSENPGDADYYYSHIPLIGNFVNYSFLGIKVPKSSWYAFEPGMIAYFFGFNVLLSTYLDEPGNARNGVGFFKYSNLLGGLFTFSSTFILFLLFYLSYMFFVKSKSVLVKGFLLLSGVGIVVSFVAFVISSGFLEASSFGDRSVRIGNGVEMLSRSDIYSLLFGNGLGSSVEIYGSGLSSGLLSLIVEQGLIVFFFTMVVVFSLLRGKFDLFAYFSFYLVTFNPVYYPMTAIGLIIAFNCKK